MYLTDQYQAEALPADVEKWATSISADVLFETMPFKSSTPSFKKDTVSLNRWNSEKHFFRDEVEVKVGFFQNLFKGTSKVVKAGVMQEAKFYRVEKTDTGREIELGVAVRLAVAASNFTVNADLSIPNLTAAAQLSLSDTRAGIYVVGSRISIGDILPAPSGIGVENYSNYVDAFDVIQKRVFNPENVQYYVPTLLGYFEE